MGNFADLFLTRSRSEHARNSRDFSVAISSERSKIFALCFVKRTYAIGRVVHRNLHRILLIRREKLSCSELEIQHPTEASLGRSLSLLSWPDLVGGSERSVVSTAPRLNERQVR